MVIFWITLAVRLRLSTPGVLLAKRLTLGARLLGNSFSSDQESPDFVQLAVEPMHHSVRQSLQVDFLHHQILGFY